MGLLWYLRTPAQSAPWAADLGDLSTLVPPSDYLNYLLPGQILFGLGLMVMVAPLTTALMRSVPVEHSGVASAFNNAVSRVGPQLAGALIFIAVSASFFAALQTRMPEVDVSSPQVREEVSPLNEPSSTAGEKLVAASRQASTDAFHVAMLISAGLCFGGALVNLLGISNKDAEQRHDQEEKREAITPCPPSPPLEAPSKGSR
jgi:hypothetical protein